MKKALKAAFAAAMALVLSIPAVGCGSKNKLVSDGKTINVVLCVQGYGRAYFDAWKSEFENLYAEEGYKINVYRASRGEEGAPIINELAMGDKNGVDMYFAGQIATGTLLATSLREGFPLAEDLTDVMQSHPINAKGEEEPVTLEEKLVAGYKDRMTVGPDSVLYADSRGKWFTLPTFRTAYSLVVNPTVLAKYDLDLPLTTKDLLNIFSVIGATSEETGVYPTCWAGQNAFSYMNCCYNVWFAQYAGVDAYNALLDGDGIDSAEEAAALYDKTRNPGLYYAMKVMETMVDTDYAPSGTLTMAHGLAQHKLLTGEAAIMANGSWLQNEMSANYPEQSKTIKMIRMPVISELGMKLALDGAGGTNEALCETVLKKIVAAVDEGTKTDAEIASGIADAEVTAEQVASVRAARAVYYDAAPTGGLVIRASSAVKDICKLFLRYIASDDGIAAQYNTTAAHSAFVPLADDLIDPAIVTPFLQSTLDAIGSDSVGIYQQARPGSNYESRTFGMFLNTKYSGLDWIMAMAQSGGAITADLILEDEVASHLARWNE